VLAATLALLGTALPSLPDVSVPVLLHWRSLIGSQRHTSAAVTHLSCFRSKLSCHPSKKSVLPCACCKHLPAIVADTLTLTHCINCVCCSSQRWCATGHGPATARWIRCCCALHPASCTMPPPLWHPAGRGV
jgi:hypothetical protein